MPRTSIALLLFCVLFAPAAFGLEPGAKAPTFSGIKDSSGATHSSADHKKQVVVLIVWSSRCPHSRRYAARLRALAGSYAPKEGEKAKVVFLGVAPNKYETAKGVEELRAKQKLPFPILLDTQGGLSRRLKAFTTPMAFVIDGDGVLQYRGAIDDDPQGKKKNTTQHLRLAIDAVLAGKKPPKAKTQGPGFRIQF